MSKRIEKKIDELIEALRAFQGEMKKGLLETNAEINEMGKKVDLLMAAHPVDVQSGKVYHKATESTHAK